MQDVFGRRKRKKNRKIGAFPGYLLQGLSLSPICSPPTLLFFFLPLPPGSSLPLPFALLLPLFFSFSLWFFLAFGFIPLPQNSLLPLFRFFFSYSPTFSLLFFFFSLVFSCFWIHPPPPEFPPTSFLFFLLLLPYFLSSFYLFSFLSLFVFPPIPPIPSYLFSLKHGRNHGCVGDHMSPTFFFYYIYIYIFTFYSTLNKKTIKINKIIIK